MPAALVVLEKGDSTPVWRDLRIFIRYPSAPEQNSRFPTQRGDGFESALLVIQGSTDVEDALSVGKKYRLGYPLGGMSQLDRVSPSHLLQP